MAETPAAGDEPRRLPTLAWVIGAVVLTAAIFACVLIHLTHAARVVGEPLANPAAAATAPAAATTTQAATTATTAQAATTTAAAAPLGQPASTAARAPATKSRAADGERLLRHGRAAAALALFQQTLAQNPDDARAQRGACVALGRLGRAKERARRCGHRSRG